MVDLIALVSMSQTSRHPAHGAPRNDVRPRGLPQLRPVPDALAQRRALGRAPCAGRVLPEARGLRLPGPHLLDQSHEPADHPGDPADGPQTVAGVCGGGLRSTEQCTAY